MAKRKKRQQSKYDARVKSKNREQPKYDSWVHPEKLRASKSRPKRKGRPASDFMSPEEAGRSASDFMSPEEGRAFMDRWAFETMSQHLRTYESELQVFANEVGPPWSTLPPSMRDAVRMMREQTAMKGASRKGAEQRREYRRLYLQRRPDECGLRCKGRDEHWCDWATCEWVGKQCGVEPDTIYKHTRPLARAFELSSPPGRLASG